MYPFISRRQLSGLLAGTAIMAIPALHVTRARAAIQPPKDRKRAPDFSLIDADGRTITLSSYKGKVVLLNFWATYCSPCNVEIPWFVKFVDTYKSRGFTAIGVSMDEGGWDSIKPYIAKKKVNYPIVIGTEKVANLYAGVDAPLPTTYMIDREGRIADVHSGIVSRMVYQGDVLSLLAEDGHKG